MARENGRLELLSDKNSALVLVDYQPIMFKSVASGDKVRIKKAAICAAKAASILGIPVVLSSINPKYNGGIHSRDHKAISRSGSLCVNDAQLRCL
jgi:hypothetical protein